MHYKMFDGSYTDSTWFDLNLVKATGTSVFDKDGKKYLDLRSGLWNTSLGYIPDIYNQVQLEFDRILKNRIPFMDMHSFYNSLYEDTAINILNILDGKFEKVLYTNTGSECTDLSLKMAISLNHKHKRNSILAFSNSYHGTFFGGISVSGLDQKLNKVFNPKYGDVTFIKFPKSKSEETCVIKWLSVNAGQYDAMIIEPVLSSAGIYSTSIHFMNSLLKVLRSNNVISIMDEIATGVYKTGTRFYFNKLDAVPDIINLSKSINNGITPFGCVCITEDINKRLLSSNIRMNHFSTQNGNLLGYISTKVVTKFYLDNINNIENMVDSIVSLIDTKMKESNLNYRQVGTMLAIPVDNIDVFEFARELKEIGILVYFYKNDEEHGISLFPPYTVPINQLEGALSIILKRVSNFQNSL